MIYGEPRLVAKVVKIKEAVDQKRLTPEDIELLRDLIRNYILPLTK